MEKPVVGQKIWDLDADCQKVWDGSEWQPVKPKYYIEMTEELSKDLEVVVDLAEGTLRKTEACSKVRDLLEKIKKDFGRL